MSPWINGMVDQKSRLLATPASSNLRFAVTSCPKSSILVGWDAVSPHCCSASCNGMAKHPSATMALSGENNTTASLRCHSGAPRWSSVGNMENVRGRCTSCKCSGVKRCTMVETWARLTVVNGIGPSSVSIVATLFASSLHLSVAALYRDNMSHSVNMTAGRCINVNSN
eukprot:scaffold185056_cov54-Attheya_sp.AAC.1